MRNMGFRDGSLKEGVARRDRGIDPRGRGGGGGVPVIHIAVMAAGAQGHEVVQGVPGVLGPLEELGVLRAPPTGTPPIKPRRQRPPMASPTSGRPVHGRADSADGACCGLARGGRWLQNFSADLRAFMSQ